MQQLEPATATTCPWCLKRCITLQGVASHITQKPACRQKQLSHENSLAASREPERASPEIDFDDQEDQGRGGDSEMNDIAGASSAFADDLPDLNDKDQGPAAPLNPGSHADSPYLVRPLDESSQPRTYGSGPTLWENMRTHENPESPFAPWSSKDEYELVEWLATSGLSQAAIDRFLGLNWVNS